MNSSTCSAGLSESKIRNGEVAALMVGCGIMFVCSVSLLTGAYCLFRKVKQEKLDRKIIHSIANIM